jgi:hypothetical protein
LVLSPFLPYANQSKKHQTNQLLTPLRKHFIYSIFYFVFCLFFWSNVYFSTLSFLHNFHILSFCRIHTSYSTTNYILFCKCFRNRSHIIKVCNCWFW